jgi:hypothetical protein
MDVVPAQYLKNGLVQAVGELRNLRRYWMLDQGPRRDVRRQPDERRPDRSGRVERRVRRLHGEKVFKDSNERAEV